MTQLEIARKLLDAEIEGMRRRFDLDAAAGERDAKAGIYDKWYRHHRRDNGAAYDAGWQAAKLSVPGFVKIIEG